jgi:integrase
MKKKITDSLLKTISKQEKDFFLWDTEIKGFGVKIYKNSTKTFIFQHKVKNKDKRTTLGKYPDLSLSLARQIASNHRIKISTGHIIEIQKEKICLLKDLIDKFKKIHYPHLRPATVEMYNTHIDKMQPLFEYDIKKITSDKLLACIDISIQIAYNRYISSTHKLFNFAIEHDLLDKNPVQKLKKFREEKREVYLSKEEVEKIFIYLSQHKYQVQANLMKLDIFTGSRIGEIRNMCWSEVDLESGIWLKHASKVKGKKTTSIPLNQMAIKVLKDMQKFKKDCVDYIFVNPVTKKPFENNVKFWKTLCKKLNLKNVRIHDLRHTFASLLINNNINLEIVSKLLGHSDVKITQRYAHLNTNSLQTGTNMIDEIFKKKD